MSRLALMSRRLWFGLIPLFKTVTRLIGAAHPIQRAAVVDVDVVVVIASPGQTNRNAVASVLSNLKRIKTNVIGVVLNEVREDMSDRYYYYG